MARYMTNGTSGNLSTAGVWDTVVNTPTINATINITVSAGGVFGATFTAPNITNNSTGCAFYVTGLPVSGSWVATLFESGLATAATATIVAANITTTGTWLYFRWITPYTYTTTTAGAYKVQIKNSTGSGNVADDSGAANPAYLVTDDRNTAPVAGDDIWVMGSGGVNPATVTVTLTGVGNSIGSGADTGTVTSTRSIGFGATVCSGGILAFDTTATAKLTSKGTVAVGPFGQFTAAPALSTTINTLTFNENGATANYGLLGLNGGKINFQGTPKTFFVTTYSSGDGSIGNPLITADAVNWSVGDNLVFAPTSNNATNYNEWEDFTVSTVNSATSYVLSGSLVNSHTAGWIANVTTNVVINTNSITQAWYGYYTGNAALDIVFKWTRFDTVGSGTTNKQAGCFLQATLVGLDNCIFYRILGFAYGVFNQSSQGAQTHSNNIFYLHNGATTACYRLASNPANQTLDGFYVLRAAGYAMLADSGFNITLKNAYTNSCMLTGTDVVYGLIGSGWTLSNINPNANNQIALGLRSLVNFVVTGGNFGTLGYNKTADIGLTSASFLDVGRFDSCNFGSPTLITGYTGATVVSGSLLIFNTMNATRNNSRWYTNRGSVWATGSGLTDTNVRTAGTFNVRISPEGAGKVTYTYYKVTQANSAASALGFIQLNAAFTADAASSCVIKMYLPNNQLDGATPDATYTMPKTDNNYDPFVLAANYAVSTPGLTRLDIEVTGSAAEYAYVADLDNGSNKLTDFEVWSLGQPSVIMPETLGDAQSVWSVATNTMTTANTTGNQVKSLLTLGSFLALT